jgi:hypothetical protein
MIVHDFYVARLTGIPSETDAPLIVDPDAVLPFSFASQRLQPVAGRIAQIVDGQRGIQQAQFIQRPLMDIRREFPGGDSRPDALSFLTTERPDHGAA